jgi:hypothetical protein
MAGKLDFGVVPKQQKAIAQLGIFIAGVPKSAPNKAQYCSLKDADGFGEVGRDGRSLPAADGELAELALDGARRAPAAAGDDALLEDLVEHPVMKAAPVLRGE